MKLNEIYLGDCLDIMTNIPDKSVDMILADLPFGTTKCKWDSVIDMNRLWIQYERVIKENGAIVLFAQTPFDKVLGCSNLKLLRYEWIWEKKQATGHLNAKKMPMKSHENILVFYKKKPTYNPQKTFDHKRKVSTAHHKRNTSTGQIYGKSDTFSDYDSTERYPRSVQKFSSDRQKLNLHSTQKPLALIEYLIKTYTDEGMLVLDNVSGSGTTGVGCKKLNRNFIMIEKDLDFYKISLERMKNTHLE
jgi:DNA modification methylase